MKKRGLVIIILLLILIAGALGIIKFLRTTSSFSSIYFVPEDAVYIFETKDPLSAWEQILNSNAWNHYKNNDFLKELNEDFQSYDSLVNSSKILLKLVGKKSVVMSQHPVGNNEYDYLYIIDIGKLANKKNPEKILSTIMGSGYEITQRDYKGTKIIEMLDIEESEYYFIALTKGKAIFAFEPKLLERSIDAAEKMVIGRDMKFLDVQSKIGHKGLFSVFIIHDNLSDMIKTFSPETGESFKTATKDIKYTGIYFDLNEDGLFTLEGYSSFADPENCSFLKMVDEGKQDLKSRDVIPLRIASLLKINFTDAKDYIYGSMESLGEVEYKEYQDNIKKIEKKLKISLEDNLFSWMKDEIVMLQTQPSNLGRTNEFAAVLHAKDSSSANENLQFLWKQIKKNTPVKIKSIDYKGYKIDYIAFPGILKALFGKALGKIEKPYFSQIGDNVIISNHPQTIKNIIDDYLNNMTLKTSENYDRFIENFDKKTGFFFYSEPPILYHNLQAFVSTETWTKIKKNKEYITCFPQAGAQINKSDDLLHFLVKAQYQSEIEDWKMQFYNSTEISSLFNAVEAQTEDNNTEEETEADTIPLILVKNLDAKKHEEFYEDGNLKLSVEIKDGLKDGDLRVYYSNGEVKIKGEFKNDEPVGKWKYYDKEGELIKTDRY